MTYPTFQPTRATDLPALEHLLDRIALFPSGMLADLIAPFLAGVPADLWLTCHMGGLPCGLCYARAEDMADGTWNMRALGIHPDHQRTGLGAKLVTALEDHLRRDGQRLLIVDTSATDSYAPARAFYTAIGYEAEARIRDFWGPGDDKVTFRKAL